MRPVCSVSSSGSAALGVAVRVLPQDLVLRVLHLQAVRGQLELAEQDDALMRMEDVVEERLVEPDRAQRCRCRSRTSISKILKRGRRVGRMPQLTTSPATDAATPGLQRRDGLEAAAILVADGKAIEQIFDRGEADALQIGGAPRPDALQVLQRSEGSIEAGELDALPSAPTGRSSRSPLPTRISRMRDGQLERVVHVDARRDSPACASSS